MPRDFSFVSGLRLKSVRNGNVFLLWLVPSLFEKLFSATRLLVSKCSVGTVPQIKPLFERPKEWISNAFLGNFCLLGLGFSSHATGHDPSAGHSCKLWPHVDHKDQVIRCSPTRESRDVSFGVGFGLLSWVANENDKHTFLIQNATWICFCHLDSRCM